MGQRQTLEHEVEDMKVTFVGLLHDYPAFLEQIKFSGRADNFSRMLLDE